MQKVQHSIGSTFPALLACSPLLLRGDCLHLPWCTGGRSSATLLPMCVLFLLQNTFNGLLMGAVEVVAEHTAVLCVGVRCQLGDSLDFPLEPSTGL